MRRLLLVFLLNALIVLANLISPQLARSQATFTIVNLDGPGEGFNDPTAAAPVGGNVGTTIGQQRLNAFQYAANIWGNLISSPVVIQVDASFDPLPCTATSATLGSAGPTWAIRDFAGAPVSNTWYTQAQANSLFGGDLSGANSDISATFSSTIGTPGCLETSGWYYGLDANPPAGKIDFVTVLLHELGHGLGFLSLVDLSTGQKYGGFDDAYMRHLEDHTTGKSYPQMIDVERVTASINTGNLHWTGSNVVVNSDGLSSGRHPSGHVQMYAPNPAQDASSVSHFDSALSPNELMEPSYTGPLHDVGLALELFADIGWIVGPPLAVTGVTADKASPQAAGTTIVFTAAISGGIAPVQYKWWLYNGTAWSVVQDWSTSNSYSWTPGAAGSYRIGVWARSNGNSNDAPENNNAFNWLDFSVTAAPAVGSLQFSASSYSVNENGGSAVITITRTGGSAGAVSVTLATSNGTATAGSDYTAVNQVVNFVDGDTANKTVNVTIVNDGSVEGNETVNLTLSSPTGGATLGSPSTAVLTIIDDDTPSPLAVTGVTADKGSPQATGTTIVFTAAISGGIAPVQYKWWLFNGTAWSVVQDWSTSNSYSWTPGAAGSYRIGVWARSSGNSNDAPENNNAFNWLDFTITAAPAAGSLQFSLSSYSVNENGGTAAITITRSGGSAGAVGVTFSTSNGTASAGSDYTAVNQVVNFANGDTANKTVNVAILNDSSVEGNETVNLTLSSPTGGASIGSPSSAVLTIVDDEAAPGPLAVTNLTADKATPQAVGTMVVFTAVISGGIAPVQYKWWLFNGTAWSVVQDWSVSNSYSWTPGAAGNYRIGVWARSSGNSTDAPENSNAFNWLDFTITAAPVPGSLQFSASSYSVNENGGSAVITITRTGGSAGAVSVTLATSNGTATAGSDYTAVNQVVNFVDGDTANKTVNVTIVNDGSVEGNETVNLTLSAPTGGASLGSPSTAVLTIVDDDTPSPLTVTGVTADKVSPQVAGTTVVFTAVTSGGTPPVQYKWWLFNGTAWSVVNNWSVSNSYSWMPGAAGSYRIGVWARSSGNSTDAPENSNAFNWLDFTITAAPVPGSLQFSAGTYSVNESGGSAMITITRSGGSAGAVSVTFATANGTATAGSDYTAVSQAVNFVNGDTASKTVNVAIINDPTVEGNETVNLTLSAPTGGASLGSPSTAVLTIVDDDTPSPLLVTGVTADKVSPQVAGTTIVFTAVTSGGTPPLQYKWWLYNGVAWSVVQDWSASSTYSWTPGAAGSYRIGVWARSSGNSTDAPENGTAFNWFDFSITGGTPAQVRAFNDLCLQPGCTYFTGRLTASEGYTWEAYSGTYSPYQAVTSPTLSNFTAEAVGYGVVVSFPGSFNITAGRRYAFAITADGAGNPVLLQIDEGSVNSTVAQQLLSSSPSIIGQRRDGSSARFASPLASAFLQ